MNKKILVLEDESGIRSFVVINLRRNGYEPVEAATGEEALAALASDPDISVALLDVMLPGMDGWQVCRTIRKTSSIPIIMLTAKDETFDKVLGLELGADDYIVKPFEVLELLVRIEKVLERTGKMQQTLEIGDITINLMERSVRKNGAEILLKPMEFNLLVMLAKNKNIDLPRAL